MPYKLSHHYSHVCEDHRTDYRINLLPSVTHLPTDKENEQFFQLVLGQEMVMGPSLASYQEVIVGLSRGLLPRINLRRYCLMKGIHRNHTVLSIF